MTSAWPEGLLPEQPTRLDSVVSHHVFCAANRLGGCIRLVVQASSSQAVVRRTW